MCNIYMKKLSILFHYMMLIFICLYICHGMMNQRTLEPLRKYQVNDNYAISYHPWSMLLRPFKPKLPRILPIAKYPIHKNQHEEQISHKIRKIKENDDQRKSFNKSYLNTHSEENTRRTICHRNIPLNFSLIDPWRPKDPKLCPVPLTSHGVPELEKLVPSIDNIPTVPPDVCGQCPAFPNDLSPCSCVGNAGSNAGLISISCNSSTNWTTMGELKYTLNSADYITTDVVRFNMSGTKVTGVLDNSVWGKLSIKQIIMNNNQISNIDNHAFNSSSESLYFLSLENNLINSFFWNLLPEVPSLTTLMLKGNQLTMIETEALPEMPLLSNLDLSYNKIDFLGANAFSKLHKLTNLKINNNKLRELCDNVFTIMDHKPSQNFFTLNVSSNEINLLNEQVFSGIKPNIIDLRNNKLISIKQSIFEPLIEATGYLIEIHLEGNPISCNCDLRWLVENSYYKFVFDNFHCADKDLTLCQLTLADLNCTQTIPSTSTYNT